LNSRAILINS